MSFIGLIIYFKKYEDVSVISIIKVLFFTTIGFVTIYYGIILGLPDIVSKFNSVLIIVFGITLIITSIILIHLTIHHNSIFNLTRIFSTLSIIFIVFLSFNKLFIKGLFMTLSGYCDNFMLFKLTQERKKIILATINSLSEGVIMNKTTLPVWRRKLRKLKRSPIGWVKDSFFMKILFKQ